MPEDTMLPSNEEVQDSQDVPQEESEVLETAFSWQASEYVHHHKNSVWYIGLFIILAVLIGVSIWMRLWLSIGVYLAMGAAIVVYAHKPPRVLLYELDAQGILIDGRRFPFSELRSFAVLPEESWHTIDLEPTKRFSPRLTLIFDDNDFDSIVGHLQLHLPRVDRKPDVIELLSRFFRF